MSTAALWFGLAGGFVGWSLQTLINLPLASHACFPALYPVGTPVLSGLKGIAFGVSLAALALCVFAAAIAWRSWSATREEHQQATGSGTGHAAGHALLETGEGRTRFMALAGVLASSTFLLVSIVHTVSIFVVHPCGP